MLVKMFKLVLIMHMLALQSLRLSVVCEFVPTFAVISHRLSKE